MYFCAGFTLSEISVVVFTLLVGIETLLFLLMSNYKDIYFPPFQKDSSFVKTRDISYNSNLLLFMVLEEDKLAHNYPDDGAPKHLFSR